MSIPTYANGSVAGIRFNSVGRIRIFLRLEGKKSNFFTTLYVSTIIGGQ